MLDEQVGGVDDGVGARAAVIQIGIRRQGPAPVDHGVVAGPGIDRFVLAQHRAGRDRVVRRTEQELFEAREGFEAAVFHRLAGFGVEGVGEIAARQVEQVDARPAMQGVMAGLGNHRVVAVVAVERQTEGPRGHHRVGARSVLIDLDPGHRGRATVDPGAGHRAQEEVEGGPAIGRGGMVQRVGACAAIDVVVELAVQNLDHVVAVTAEDVVGHKAAQQRVVAAAADQRVHAPAAFQPVGARPGFQPVGGVAADDGFGAGPVVEVVLEPLPDLDGETGNGVGARAQIEGRAAE